MIPLVSPIPQTSISHPLVATWFFHFFMLQHNYRFLSQGLRDLSSPLSSRRPSLTTIYLSYTTDLRLIHIVPLPVSFVLLSTLQPLSMPNSGLKAGNQSSLWSSTIISSCISPLWFHCIFCLLSHPQFLQEYPSLQHIMLYILFLPFFFYLTVCFKTYLWRYT